MIQIETMGADVDNNHLLVLRRMKRRLVGSSVRWTPLVFGFGSIDYSGGLFSILNSGSTRPNRMQSAEAASAIVTAFGINGRIEAIAPATEVPNRTKTRDESLP